MPTPVLADGTGRSTASVRWARRVVSAAVATGAAAIVLSVFTDVSPSRGLPDPTPSKLAAEEPKRSPSPSPGATTPSPTSPARTATATDAAATTAETSTPTATPTTSGKVKDPPRAGHTPGIPPTEPPGKAK